ncbi:poly-gamma-glutamate hydrolase family protein [Streptomyces collinus]|uniref:poly-gamma-glutamate hydrolase family protein n=1 Tax=Streptomyces collinus TaxID=42684 RepID=UPI0029439DE6|nr:poly-gamma-glutamate hydrolase family protein [Streptomyces collinus]
MARGERVVIEGAEFSASLTAGSDIGLLALHAGTEGGTAELAEEVAARTGATTLVFTQPAGDPVHLPSHRMAVDHCAALREFLASVTVVVSLHGHLRRETPRAVFLGGANRAAARILGRELTAHAPDFEAVTDLDAIPAGLRGLHPRNPVNLTPEAGVQVELPLGARTLRPGKVRGVPDLPPPSVAAALTAGVERLAARPRAGAGRGPAASP